jgi:rhodanese-related sulfurtransferase
VRITTHIRFLSLAAALLFLGKCAPTYAQSNVEGSGYNLMLKTLLSHSVPEITVDSLNSIISSVQLVDSRELEEYKVSHIEGALFSGYNNFDSTIVDQLDPNRPIIVYCSIGYRSEKIAERLIEAGFTNVYNLYGGIFEWVNQSGDIVDEDGETNRVHAYSRTWGIWLKDGEKVYE